MVKVTPLENLMVPLVPAEYAFPPSFVMVHPFEKFHSVSELEFVYVLAESSSLVCPYVKLAQSKNKEISREFLIIC